MKNSTYIISSLVALLVVVFSTACFGSSTLIQKNDNVEVRFSSDTRTFEIKDLRNDLVWTSDAIDEGIELVNARRSKGSIELELRDKATDAIFNAMISLGSVADVVFELSAGENDMWSEKLAKFPPVFTADIKNGSLLITDRNSGTLIDQKDNVYSEKVINVYGAWPIGLSLPFTGIVTPDGRGLMVLFDTPTDAALKIVKKADGIHWPAVQWRPSMQKFNYTRKVIYKPFDKGGYVAMAKDYRQYLINKGQFKTLAQKAKERPKVAWLKGAPSIWGWPYSPEFTVEGFNYGITRAVINGRVEKERIIEKKDMAVLTKQGWLGGTYDVYTDIRENIERDALIPTPNAAPHKGWRHESGVQTYTLSSAMAVDRAKAKVPDNLKKFDYTQRFIDVASCIDLFEDYHPKHTYDRRGDMENRRNLLQYFNDVGLVTRGEFGNAWAVDKVDMLMGAMSSTNFQSWNMFLHFPAKGRITDRYRKYAMGYDIKIPLWQLVFHDCVVDTWYWADSPGFVYQQAPELATRKDLFNILYGTVPLLWPDKVRGYGWNRNRDRFMQTYQVTCKLHEEIAFDEMLNHEYLSDDKSLQKTIFSSGANVIVNFGMEPKVYTYGEKTVKIAGEGFFVHGIDMQQSKLIEDGKTVTKIIKDGYQVLDVTGGEVQIGAIKLDGKIAAFKVNDNRWNLFLSSGKTYEIDLAVLTGWDKNSDFKVSFMNDKGDRLEDVPAEVKNGKMRYLAAPGMDMIMVTR